ncbi:MAG: hypothetical protein COV52_02810 [Gammaproteobacteria bacterium CG11_big_fil_rev_8_21_14_0_20_46_22]|nr:MAG: hypothetical protein COW05_08845 [Gammaproteobacteria bacterium CG12_big_fil_rev_8_21_14_0_65_46_12]PIR11708.1 MAG: hypothetical protein COV52_02810 [Gammaproteobacteria bacterium CG11_big_fil_rev_8_21_14_0_20_46_22]
MTIKPLIIAITFMSVSTICIAAPQAAPTPIITKASIDQNFKTLQDEMQELQQTSTKMVQQAQDNSQKNLDGAVKQLQAEIGALQTAMNQNLKTLQNNTQKQYNDLVNEVKVLKQGLQQIQNPDAGSTDHQ